ncbi:chromosome partition protein Smc [Spirochaetota bacterium]|nr:chromosome partition protein Smc [Spirochaetota bacterium]
MQLGNRRHLEGKLEGGLFLKKLIVQNFKGFAERTTIEFFPGIGALIGPNGCGKSNVVDAVKWVLGAQKVSEVRGDKMNDLIFNGSATTTSHHYAEVEIVFDNSAKVFSLPQQEVSIARRLYRSGEMEYLINNEQCRLKDVHYLLLDTGLGRLDYSIMAQGSVSKILESSNTQRMRLIEEAASISKYRERHREYERKILKVTENLKHIEILYSNITKRKNALQKQTQASQGYFKIKKLLKHLELFQNLQTLKAIEKKQNTNHNETQQINQKLQALSTLIKQQTTRSEQLDQSAAKASDILQNETFKFKNELSVLHEKQKFLSERHSERTLELATQTKRIKQIEKNLHASKQTVATTEKSALHHEKILAHTRKELEGIRSALVVCQNNRKNQETIIATLEGDIAKNNALIDSERKTLDAIPELLFKDLEKLFPLSKLLAQEKKQKDPQEKLRSQLETLSQELHTTLENHLRNLLSLDPAAYKTALKTSFSTLKATTTQKINALKAKCTSLIDRDSNVTGIVKVIENVYRKKDVILSTLQTKITTAQKFQSKLKQAQKDLKKIGASKETLTVTQAKIEKKIAALNETIAPLRTDLARVKHYQTEQQADYDHYQKINSTLKTSIAGLIEQKKAIAVAITKTNVQAKTTTAKWIATRKNEKLSHTKLKNLKKNIGTLEQKYQKLNKQRYELSAQTNIFANEYKTLLEHTETYLDENLLDYRTRPEATKTLIKNSFITQEILDQISDRNPKPPISPPAAAPTHSAPTEQSQSMPKDSSALKKTNLSINLKTLTPRQLAKLIQICRDRLSGHNNINPLAEEELEEIAEEYSRIAKERLDIKNSLKNLSVLAQQVNRQSKKIFAKTFKQIAKNFKHIVKELFEGGTGNLAFKSHPNPDQNQIIISVQPPGKDVQNIDLFSGGEKTLIALALMFAIFKTKFSPFCILDEADAALDDENISRFLKLLKAFQRQTQILIISHNRKTFHAFDYLYGISMREGMSKIFSLKTDPSFATEETTISNPKHHHLNETTTS